MGKIIDFNQESRKEGLIMLVDFTKVLNNYDGKPLVRDDGSKGAEVPLTLHWTCCTALMANHNEDKATPQEKKARYFLARKIDASIKLAKGPCKLSDIQVDTVKTLIASCFATPIIGASYAVLDGDDKEVTDEA